MSHSLNIKILHARNHGEIALGQRQLRVDGYSEEHKLAFQFHGCYWHGHPCSKTQGKCYNETSKKSFIQLQYETQQKDLYLKKIGYSVTYMKECEWAMMK